MKSSKTTKKLLLKDWESDEYFQELKASSFDEKVLFKITKFARDQPVVFEIGCGEGTKLNSVCKYALNEIGIGVDLSRHLLKRATRTLQNGFFLRADGEVLPFRKSIADVTLSMYTLEHLTKPETVIEEMIRITKKEGYLIFLAPNYGSPFFPSPCNRHNILRRFVKALVTYLASSYKLNWEFVSPRITEKWKSDFDCVVEPFLPSLEKFLVRRKVQVIISECMWRPGNFVQSLFFVTFAKTLLKHFGPQFLIIGRKQMG